MMKYLKLSDIKAQLRIETDDEDALLQLYGAALEDTMLNLLGRSLEELMETYGEVPAPIRLATLMLTAGQQNYREPQTPVQLSAVPYTFDLMVKPYIKL